MYDELDSVDETALFEQQACSPELRIWLREYKSFDQPIVVDEPTEPPVVLDDELEDDE